MRSSTVDSLLDRCCESLMVRSVPASTCGFVVVRCAAQIWSPAFAGLNPQNPKWVNPKRWETRLFLANLGLQV